MQQRDQVGWQERARQSLAGGVSSQFRAADPVVFSHGSGSHIWDIDGNEYIDFTLSQGPLIHGHSHPEILDAVRADLAKGQIWNGLHRREIELAEKLIEIIPCADMVRLGCTGSEAVHAALRLARASTGRDKVIKFEGHYHGWLDSVAASINPPLLEAGPDDSPAAFPWTDGIARGALNGIDVALWNSVAALEQALDRNSGDVAAVIMEPCMCNAGCIEPAPNYLAAVRELCDRHGVLLIFDEVITGFRLALGGAQQLYGISPDLAIFGKAVACGFPLSVLAGRAEVMRRLADGRTIHAGTLNAQVGCVAAATASVRLFERDAAFYGRLHRFGSELLSRLTAFAEQAGFAVLATGPGSVFHFGFLVPPTTRSGLTVRNYRDVARVYDMPRYAEFVRRMASRGVRLIGRGIWYICAAHSQADFDLTCEAARQTFQEMARESTHGDAKGPPP